MAFAALRAGWQRLVSRMAQTARGLALTETQLRRRMDVTRSGWSALRRPLPGSMCIAMIRVQAMDAAGFGHAVALDAQVSRQLGPLLAKGLRPGDLLGARQAGQFMVVLPGATPSAGRMAAERLCALVQDAPLRDRAGHLLCLQVAVMVGSVQPGRLPTLAWDRLAAAMAELAQDQRRQVLLMSPGWLD